MQGEKQESATVRECMDPFSYMGIGFLLGVIGVLVGLSSGMRLLPHGAA